VLVEDDGAGLATQKLLQPRLAFAQGPRPQVLTIEFEKVERVQDRLADVLAVQRFNTAMPSLARCGSRACIAAVEAI
jgi:hypothetical protein